MKKLLVLIVLLLACMPQLSLAQSHWKVNAYCDMALEGDKGALKKLVNLTHSRARVKFYIGHHVRHGQLGRIAYWRLIGLLSIKPDEWDIAKHKKRENVKWLQKHFDQLHFDTLSGYWLLTPLQNRPVQYMAKKITASQLARDSSELNPKYFNLYGYSKTQLDSMLALKDPIVFAHLAYNMLKLRNYIMLPGNTTALIRKLTGVDIFVKGYSGAWVNHFTYDYYDTAQLNYALFWINNYKSFVWNEEKKRFVNTTLVLEPPSEMETYIERLCSPADSIAMQAFVELTNNGFEFDVSFEDHMRGFYINRSLPIFWKSFLKTIRTLKTYNTLHGFSNSMPANIKADAELLLKPMLFKQRYACENRLVQNLTPENIAAFEQYMLLYENNNEAQYSAGRILDIFYSEHWNEILASHRYLAAYLYKMVQMDNLGIVGLCNNYSYKFAHSAPETIKTIQQLADSMNNAQLQKAVAKIAANHTKYESVNTAKPTVWGDVYTTKAQLLAEWDKAKNSGKSDISLESDLLGIMYHIDYAILIEGIPLMDTLYMRYYAPHRYDFIVEDAGIPVDGIYTDSIRTQFVANFKTMPTKQLYLHYILNSGFDILDSSGALDYKKIYRILKYDLPEPLTGSGWYRYWGVLGIVKLMEMELGTNLGLKGADTTKVTNMAGSIHLVARAWRQYLVKSGKVPPGFDTTPISFAAQDPNREL